MNRSDDGTVNLDSGCLTPPLSPSKTVSTEGWMSPRTPVSPRKSQSCVFFRNIETDTLLHTPPDSPTKVKLPSRFDPIQFADVPKLDPCLASSPSDEGSPVKKRSSYLDGSSTRRSIPFASPNSRTSPDRGVYLGPGSALVSGGTTFNKPSDLASSPVPEAHDDHGSYPASPTQKQASLYSDANSPSILGPCLDNLDWSANTETSDIASPTRLRQLPLRHASSPLRPSQWVARGGLLTGPRHQTRALDRFIPSRRPPNITRESFELNKPAERLTSQERFARNGVSTVDPFGRRLHRSRRLNEELRGLRETHSVLMGRTSMNRRAVNPSLRRNSFTQGTRHISAGAVWNVGGSSAVSDTVVAVSNGRGGMLGSGTNAPLYTSMFLSRSDPEAELEAYERRLALALDIDQTDRVLQHTTPTSSPLSGNFNSPPLTESRTNHVWRDNAWTKDSVTAPARARSKPRKPVPILPFRVLDAPQLRDDYYCSLLAYSHSSKCLAVGLGNFVHLWSERKGVDTPESLNSLTPTTASGVQHVTSLSFSSTQGGQAILAVGRADGRIALWSPFDSEPRFDATQPKPISCLAFRPTIMKRPSLRDGAMSVSTEELLIGDEAGDIYFYSIEWPSETESALFGWNGAMTLLARMTIHSQQICGLSWSVDGEFFASGGNDNACYLFETKKVLHNFNNSTEPASTVDVRQGPNGESIFTVTPGRGAVIHVPVTRAKHKWELNAAVKAIAFCPWQRGLLAIGGGSNDRCIHFYHTMSGACLATIDCAAQVTSLIWSQTRREIAATFGFAQPEHPYRIAVFSWPSCEQVVSVPWFDENRALFAVSYPGGPESGSAASNEAAVRAAGEEGMWWKRTAEEGCIVVAASDAAIRFHEIWTGGKKGLGCRTGLLGGSDILESLHGIEREGEAIIR